MNGEVVRVESSAEVDAHGEEHKAGDDTDEHVGDSVKGRNERRSNKSTDDGPIQGDGQETITSSATKELVDDDTLGPDPAKDGEIGQASEDPSGEPVPDESS